MTQNRYKLRSMTRRFDVGQPTTARAKSRTENRGLRELASKSYKEPDTEESEAENVTILESRSTKPKANVRAKADKAQRAETSEQQSSQDKGESAKSFAHKGSRRGIPNYKEPSSDEEQSSEETGGETSEANADRESGSGYSQDYRWGSDHRNDDYCSATGSDDSKHSDFEPTPKKFTNMANTSKRRG